MIPKIIFIVPYRDRTPHKHFFINYMKIVMEDYKEEEYEIYFAHQCDKRPFNRGAMKNIGFLAMKKKYPKDYRKITFVFNDVDTVPYKKNMLPYETTDGVVKHFYGFNFALGGIFSITGNDFEKTNGFPNSWGWSGEDNLMQSRVIHTGLQIDRSVFYNIHSKDILHLIDEFSKYINKKDLSNMLSGTYIYGLNALRNLKYEIYDNFINISYFDCEMNPTAVKLENHDITKNNSNKISVPLNRGRNMMMSAFKRK